MTKADPDALHVCVETFATTIDNVPVVVERGSHWRGQVVSLHGDYFIPVDEADEPALHAARAALAARIGSA